MYNKCELELVQEVFSKCQVGFIVIKKSQIAALEDYLDKYILFRGELVDLLNKRTLEPNKVYKYGDTMGQSYRIFMLPAVPENEIVFVGPFLPTKYSNEYIFELAEKSGIDPQRQKHLLEYYQGIPILPNDSHIWVLFNSFCSRAFSCQFFSVEELFGYQEDNSSPVTETLSDYTHNETLLSMKTMERRYAFENEIMRAVELGIPFKETRLHNAFNDNYFENRASDPIRNIKNYSIIMNTLLRKAAEKAGVHPIHLDKLSSEIARNIEDFSSIAQTTELMSSIFNQYSSLVRNERTLGYSEVVKKTIVLIESDLSSNLSSSSLAEALDLSLGYLSSLFKKEVGKCLSEYIREKRMKYACHLLETTNLQIQTVALHCGIMDLQYFSKIFKKTFGITPSEYRNQFFQKGKNNSAHK